MLTGSLGILVLGTVLIGVDGATFSTLKSSVTGGVGESAMLTASVSNVGDSVLSWLVGGKYIANVSISVTHGVASLSRKTNSNATLYGATFVANGTTVDTNFTLNKLDLTLNGTEIKLTDGSTRSNVATIIVQVMCNSPPNSATAQCNTVGCTASGERNDTSTTGKYRKCSSTYSCQNNGTWSQSSESCSELICLQPGMWGDNCGQTCGAGCPEVGSVRICFANGSCANSGYSGVVPCMTGYSGDKCDQMATTESGTDSAGTTATLSTPTTASSPSTGTPADVTPTTKLDKTTTPSIEKDECQIPPDGDTSCSEKNRIVTLSKYCIRSPGTNESCEVTWKCNNETWTLNKTQCTVINCLTPGTWGPKCRNPCGRGCSLSLNETSVCDVTTGDCIDPDTGAKQTKCAEGYSGTRCDEPVCKEDCNGGTCLAPNFCGNCPMHFEHGKTCRNIRLDGFLKGSLPSLAVLAVVVTVLSLISKWYIRNKIKEA